MASPGRAAEDLFEKIRSLSPDRLSEVEDFVDFLRERDLGLSRGLTKLSEQAFRKVWDNPHDADYDRL